MDLKGISDNGKRRVGITPCCQYMFVKTDLVDGVFGDIDKEERCHVRNYEWFNALSGSL